MKDYVIICSAPTPEDQDITVAQGTPANFTIGNVTVEDGYEYTDMTIDNLDGDGDVNADEFLVSWRDGKPYTITLYNLQGPYDAETAAVMLRAVRKAIKETKP